MENNNDAHMDTSKPTEVPNENSGIYVRGFVKIVDPETGEVLVETAN